MQLLRALRLGAFLQPGGAGPAGAVPAGRLLAALGHYCVVCHASQAIGARGLGLVQAPWLLDADIAASAATSGAMLACGPFAFPVLAAAVLMSSRTRNPAAAAVAAAAGRQTDRRAEDPTVQVMTSVMCAGVTAINADTHDAWVPAAMDAQQAAQLCGRALSPDGPASASPVAWLLHMAEWLPRLVAVVRYLLGLPQEVAEAALSST
uniref:Cytochrome c domain-containing protein n=1 Tax=Chlamydomonas leiostraca TaxID=1034604 RepID=A0A6T8R9D1_9CHLO